MQRPKNETEQMVDVAVAWFLKMEEYKLQLPFYDRRGALVAPQACSTGGYSFVA